MNIEVLVNGNYMVVNRGMVKLAITCRRFVYSEHIETVMALMLAGF